MPLFVGSYQSHPAGVTHSAYVPAGATLVWNDEFTGFNIGSGATQWNWRFGLWNVNYLSGNSDGFWKTRDEETWNAGTVGSILHGTYGNKTRYLHEVTGGTLKMRCYPIAAMTQGADGSFQYVAGMISSEKFAAQEFGYWETRMRINSITDGMHLAVWLLANDGSYPPELDLMEAVAGDTPAAVGMIGKFAAVYHAEAGKDAPADQSFISMGGLYNDWNVIGATKDGADMIVHYNGTEVYRTADTVTAGKQLFFVVTWEGASVWPGDPTGDTVWPGEVEIEYVRAYSMSEVTDIPDNVPNGPAALQSPWLLADVTRSVGSGANNPPLVTLTETATTADHVAYRNGDRNISGNQVGTLYLRAGTRRYVGLWVLNAVRGFFATVDTQAWTIVETGATGGGTYTSSSLTNLSNGDYKLEVLGSVGASGADYSQVYLGATATGGPGESYLGNGSTAIIRGVDVSAGAPSYTPPTLSNGTTLTNNTNTTSTTFTGGYNSVTGKVLARVAARANSASSIELTCTIGGVALTRLGNATVAGTSNSVVAIFYGTGIPTGAQDVVIAEDQGSSNGKVVARINDLPSGWTFATGAVGSAGTRDVTSGTTVASSITPTQTGSLLVAVGCVANGSLTHTVSSPFTEEVEGATGTASGTTTSAVFATSTGGTAGVSTTFTDTWSAAFTDGAALAVEII